MPRPPKHIKLMRAAADAWLDAHPDAPAGGDTTTSSSEYLTVAEREFFAAVRRRRP